MQEGKPPLFCPHRAGAFRPGRPGGRVAVFRILPDLRLHPFILRHAVCFRCPVSFIHPAGRVSDVHAGSGSLQGMGHRFLAGFCPVSAAVGFTHRRINPRGRRSLRTTGRCHRPGSGTVAHRASCGSVRSRAHQACFSRHTAVRTLRERMLRAGFLLCRFPGIGNSGRHIRSVSFRDRYFHILFFCDANPPAAPGKLIQIIAFFVQDCRLL